jgi:signal peptidase II
VKTLHITIAVTFAIGLIAAIAADSMISDPISIVGSFVELRYSLNPGIAWGIRLPGGVQEMLILLALVAVGSMAIKARNTLSLIAFGCIIGGGLANIIDRLRDGYVTDYVSIGSFPIFNVPDSFVSVGVGLLLVEAFLAKRQG